jgi:hypothetical protein
MLCFRTCQTDDFALDMEDIVRPDRQHPAKIVNPEAYQGMWAKRAKFHTKAHGDGGGVPSRCCKTLEDRFSGSVIVQMKWLRVELRREILDVIFQDLDGLTFKSHSQGQIFEPLDHSLPPQRRYSLEVQTGQIALCVGPKMSQTCIPSRILAHFTRISRVSSFEMTEIP